MTLASASGLSRSLLQVLLLILSQDTSFANIVHKIYLPDVPWYKEQQVGGRGEGGGRSSRRVCPCAWEVVFQCSCQDS